MSRTSDYKRPSALHTVESAAYILHPARLHPTSCILHPTSCILHLTSYILHDVGASAYLDAAARIGVEARRLSSSSLYSSSSRLLSSTPPSSPSSSKRRAAPLSDPKKPRESQRIDNESAGAAMREQRQEGEDQPRRRMCETPGCTFKRFHEGSHSMDEMVTPRVSRLPARLQSSSNPRCVHIQSCCRSLTMHSTHTLYRPHHYIAGPIHLWHLTLIWATGGNPTMAALPMMGSLRSLAMLLIRQQCQVGALPSRQHPTSHVCLLARLID